jgi:hypothetical protein
LNVGRVANAVAAASADAVSLVESTLSFMMLLMQLVSSYAATMPVYGMPVIIDSIRQQRQHLSLDLAGLQCIKHFTHLTATQAWVVLADATARAMVGL